MRRCVIAGCALLTLILILQSLRAGNLCPGSVGPDVIVADLPKIRFRGAVDGISGYSIATTSCNILWHEASNMHPVMDVADVLALLVAWGDCP